MNDPQDIVWVGMHKLTPEMQRVAVIAASNRFLQSLDRADRRDGVTGCDSLRSHYCGAAAEVLFAGMLGIEDFVPHVNRFEDEGDVSDFEVKVSVNTRTLKVHPEKRTRIHVGLTGDPARGLRFLGWYDPRPGADLMLNDWILDPGNRGRPAYFVPQHELRAMSTLPVQSMAT